MGGHETGGCSHTHLEFTVRQLGHETGGHEMGGCSQTHLVNSVSSLSSFTVHSNKNTTNILATSTWIAVLFDLLILSKCVHTIIQFVLNFEIKQETFMFLNQYI